MKNMHNIILSKWQMNKINNIRRMHTSQKTQKQTLFFFFEKTKAVQGRGPALLAFSWTQGGSQRPRATQNAVLPPGVTFGIWAVSTPILEHTQPRHQPQPRKTHCFFLQTKTTTPRFFFKKKRTQNQKNKCKQKNLPKMKNNAYVKCS